ncbi:MAG: hypothetical protein ABEJ68_09810 [Halobacteriaceae archaeon]
MSALETEESALARRIRDRGEEIRREELSQALSKLDDLTPAQRRAVEEMTENVVDALLTPPAEAIRDAEDPETLAAARAVFDPESRH